jgi:hypothetical protein
MVRMKKLDLETAIERIIKLNTELCAFWSNASGWAPDGAAALMSKSRLDRQVSLSKCLRIWIDDKTQNIGDGALILAWANLGSLIEGTLKLFLAVYYEDYQKDIEAFKNKKGNIVDPDVLVLEKLRVFFNKKKLWSDEWNEFVFNVQHYRNAIHFFEDKDIRTFEELEESVRTYLLLLREIISRLPYPDDVYEPREI